MSVAWWDTVGYTIKPLKGVALGTTCEQFCQTTPDCSPFDTRAQRAASAENTALARP